MSRILARIEHRIVGFGRIVLIAFVLGVILTLVLSEAKPRPLEVVVTDVESVAGDRGIRISGRVQGAWGPFVRGWGQLVTEGGVSLLASDGRGYALKGHLEELFAQNYLWPPNWFRAELWFTETIPRPVGFTQVRVFVLNREGKKFYSAPVPIDGRMPVVQLPPKDIATLGKLGTLTLRFQEKLDAGKVRLAPW